MDTSPVLLAWDFQLSYSAIELWKMQESLSFAPDRHKKIAK
jgi:hypothetical protein